MTTPTTMRFNVATDTPKLYEALMLLNAAISDCGFDPRLIHLVKIRASQINGCAYCVAMHVKEGIADGIEESLLHLLSVWQESSKFSARERAALAWAERLTTIAGKGVSDSDFRDISNEFSEQEIAQLSVAIGMINLWNRIAVSSHMPA